MAIRLLGRQPKKRLTVEDILVLFQESKAEHDRMIMEAEKRAQESKAEYDRKFQESKAEHDRMIMEAEKRSQEYDRKFQESKAEHDRMIIEAEKQSQEMKEVIKAMGLRVDRVTQNVGGLNRSMGELIEILITANLWEKFAAYPYHLERAYQRVSIYDEHNKPRTDIDILLSDTEWCMAVEVKRHADNKDVDQHLQRMKMIRRYPPLEVKGKRMLGAIAGGVVPPETIEYAHKAGFFVLTLAGESVTLVDSPQNFVPGEW